MSTIMPSFFFNDLGSRTVQADFSGGHLTSDGGLLLLRQVNHGLGLTRGLAQCFHDLRSQDYVDHSVQQLLDQRLYGLALGYEDINDHERLRLDHLLAVACDKRDPLGLDRIHPEHRGVALAGASTLNRLELSNNVESRAHKIPHDPAQIEACLLEIGSWRHTTDTWSEFAACPRRFVGGGGFVLANSWNGGFAVGNDAWNNSKASRSGVLCYCGLASWGPLGSVHWS